MKLEVVTNLVSVTLLTGALATVLTIFLYSNSSTVCATNQLMRQKSSFLDGFGSSCISEQSQYKNPLSSMTESTDFCWSHKHWKSYGMSKTEWYLDVSNGRHLWWVKLLVVIRIKNDVGEPVCCFYASTRLTYIKRRVLLVDVVVDVGHSQRLDGCGSNTD